MAHIEQLKYQWLFLLNKGLLRHLLDFLLMMENSKLFCYEFH